jgi:hypothetical protein
MFGAKVDLYVINEKVENNDKNSVITEEQKCFQSYFICNQFQ